MQRIDFIGSPGVGKSALYRELVQQRVKSDTWLTPEEARARIAYCYLENNTQSIKDYATLWLLKNVLLKKLHPILSNRILDGYQKEIIWREKERYENFFEVALKGATVKEKAPLRRLLGITNFFTVASNVISLYHSNIHGLVIFDESLSHKIYTITHWQKGYYENLTNEFFNTIPLPQGVIYCKLDPEKTLHRIKQRGMNIHGRRGKIIPGHCDLDDNLLLESITAQLDIAAIGVDVLQKRDVKILEINMENSLEQNIKRITNAIGDFV